MSHSLSERSKASIWKLMSVTRVYLGERSSTVRASIITDAVHGDTVCQRRASWHDIVTAVRRSVAHILQLPTFSVLQRRLRAVWAKTIECHQSATAGGRTRESKHRQARAETIKNGSHCHHERYLARKVICAPHSVLRSAFCALRSAFYALFLAYVIGSQLAFRRNHDTLARLRLAPLTVPAALSQIPQPCACRT